MNKADYKILKHVCKNGEVDPELFWKKYRHIGYAGLGVPKGWINTVTKALIEIEALMWPGWMPRGLKQLIHYLSTDNSVVRVKYWWAYHLEQKLKTGQVTDVKTKYAALCIYGNFTDEQEAIVDKAEKACFKLCEKCGSTNDLATTQGWYELLCPACRGDRPIYEEEA
jgi:hypothetical protein